MDSSTTQGTTMPLVSIPIARRPDGLAFDKEEKLCVFLEYTRAIARRPDGLAFDKEEKLCVFLEYTRAMDTTEDWAERKEQKNDRYSSQLGFINHLSHRRKSGWKASQTNFTTGVRGSGSLYTNQFLTRLESLGVKNKNTREAIRNRTVQKTLSMSNMILKFFFIALNSKIDWTLKSLTTEIVNKNMERLNLHLQPPRL